MKSRMKLMVRAYDKALMVFDFLQHNKRERRRWATFIRKRMARRRRNNRLSKRR